MPGHIDATIRDLQSKLQEKEREVLETKQTINQLCALAGRGPMYSDAELEMETRAAALGDIRADTFYGQPLARSVRTYLEMRRAANQGPAKVSEIFEALKRGGFQFDTKNDENAKRGLRISLTKNSSIFHKLPNGSYGLGEWYPTVARSRGGGRSESDRALAATESVGAEETEEGTEAEEDEAEAN